MLKEFSQKYLQKLKLKVFDERSYRQCSDKLLEAGFVRKFGVDDAIEDIINNFNNGNIKDNPSHYTVKWLKRLK